MARARITDPLLTNRFQLFDVSFTLPPVLLPVFGFRSVSFPEVTITHKMVKEGNYEYPRIGAVERAEVSTATLEQGVNLVTSDFWNWIRKAVEGNVEARDLLLVQFTGISTGKASTKVLGPFANVLTLGTGDTDGFRIPGRAWLWKRCKPVSYKPGTDLEAMSSEISVASLTVQPEEIEEFSLGI